MLANEAVARSQQHVYAKQRCVTAWETAFDATAAERTRLTDAVSAIYDALDNTRPDRVAAAATDPTHPLWTTLGPAPTTRGGLAAWCAIAEQLETRNDRHPTQDHGAGDTRNQGAISDRHGLTHTDQPDDLTALLINAANIIRTANRVDPTPAGKAFDERITWQATLETARRVLAVEHAVPQIEHDLGLGL